MHFWTELRGLKRVTVRGDITWYIQIWNFNFNYHLKANQVNFSPFSRFELRTPSVHRSIPPNVHLGTVSDFHWNYCYHYRWFYPHCDCYWRDCYFHKVTMNSTAITLYTTTFQFIFIDVQVQQLLLMEKKLMWTILTYMYFICFVCNILCAQQFFSVFSEQCDYMYFENQWVV